MPDISLDLRAIEYVTESGVRVRAWRAFVDVEFVVQRGPDARYECFVDPGAPFSVIPFSLWHDRGLQWTRLGSQLSPVPAATSSPIMWQGVPCDLGEGFIHLSDRSRAVRTGPHRVVAKFAQRPQIAAMENAAILGMSFLADNDIRLMLDSIDGQMTGFLTVSDL